MIIKLPHTTSWTKAEEALHDSWDEQTHTVLYEVYEAIPELGLHYREESGGREGAGWWIIGTPAEVEAEMQRLGISQYEDKAELGFRDE